VKQTAAVVLLLAGVLLYNDYERTDRLRNQFDEYTQAIERSEEERTEEEQHAIATWERRTQPGEPDRSEIDVPRSTIYQSWVANIEPSTVRKGGIFNQGLLFRTLIMMMLGIMLYKLGVFRDCSVVKYYWPITLLILVAALTINYFRYYQWTYTYFEPVKIVWQSWLFTMEKHLLGFAYILLFNGLYQKYWRNWSNNPISSAGRMALTNYIMQSVIFGLIFYGYGLGKFNQYARTELLLIVAAIWVFQLALSWFWIHRFGQGPLEKLWRRLTYSSFR
jgi:uncharacterized protein